VNLGFRLNLGSSDGTLKGRLLSAPQTFTASGTYTKTPGTNLIRVRGVGGGGGGGGCPSTVAGQQATASGGGAGAYAEAFFNVSALSTINVLIGAHGNGGATGSNAGTAGGSSQLIGLLTIPGGTAGTAGVASTATAGVFPAANSTVLPTITGGTLINALPSLNNGGLQIVVGTQSVCGGGGGNSLFGGGNYGGTGVFPGTAATGYGAGGGGSAQSQQEAGSGGWNGSPGYFVIEEYA
jgi:hypothetical protein